MVYGKRGNARRNRQSTRQLHSQIAKVSSGEPSAVRRNRGDPPPIPTRMTNIIRIRFNVSLMGDKNYDSSNPKTTITVSQDPFLTPTVIFNWPTDGTKLNSASFARSAGFTAHLIANATYLRSTGHSPDASAQVIKNSTFTVKSVRVFGPTRENCSQVTLRGLFSDEQPGFTGVDAPGGRSRSFVGFTMPRQEWFKYDTSATETVIAVDYTDLTPGVSSVLLDTASVSLGTIDMVVSIVRSFFPSAKTVNASTGAAHSMSMG